MSKNWPNDVRVGCKAPSNLVELRYFKLISEAKINEFENSFEQANWKRHNLVFSVLYIFEMWSRIFRY